MNQQHVFSALKSPIQVHPSMNISCDTVQSLIEVFVDEELHGQARKEIQDHLETCGSCSISLTRELHFRETIRRALQMRIHPPEALQQRIRKQLELP